MRVKVLYFAIVRERLRRDEETLELPEGTTVGGLLDRLSREHPAVAALRRHLQVARNRQGEGEAAVLAEGDEVALIPPVSGGSGEAAARRPLVAVRAVALDLTEVVRDVAHDGAGGVVSFTGLVRRQSRGRAIDRLEYEAYQAMAEDKLVQIAAALEEKHGARLAILHRVGKLAVGEVAVVIAASAAHRAEAFAAAREAIERLKAEVPIWKKEVGVDGEEWIGLGP
jgi:molybdopterin converting factor subunit 1